jgi:prephenate dehydrogenase
MAAQPEAPFRTIAVAGLGLIGGSIALAVRERWPSIRVIGIDTGAVLAHALGSGAIDRAAGSLAEAPDADLLVLAAPVQQNIELLAAVAGTRPVVVTDVGGTKRAIVEKARRLPERITFLGGHPLGGGERGGFAFARPDLFANRPWIFTPGDERSAGAVGLLSAFVGGFGARPTTMEAVEHDRLMAYISHLPQLAASALMDVVGGAATAEGLRLAGKGLLDTTRLASSPPDVWRDICATNADAIGEALDALIARLTHLRADLQHGEAIDAVFDRAARWRAELVKEGR